MNAWAFADADPDADGEETPEAAEAEGEPGKVEDIAVGKLRLWLRGMFGGDLPRD